MDIALFPDIDFLIELVLKDRHQNLYLQKVEMIKSKI
jgi:hypothetical protein